MRFNLSFFVLLCLIVGSSFRLFAQDNENNTREHRYLFEQLGKELPSPNSYRTASGAPGEQYWQQQADYVMQISLDEVNNVLSGQQNITYHNNSPHTLRYLWVQLDQNVRAQDALGKQVQSLSQIPDTSATKLFNEYVLQNQDFDGGFKIAYVKDSNGKDLTYRIVNTMMRIELPTPMKQGDQFSFDISWSYNINDRMTDGGRSGYEFFPEDGNALYTIAQFYPRMAAYTDAEGWQNKQFLGQGEFALTFGNFEVEITVPDDHILAATGVLQNESDVLSKEQQKRMEKARKSTDKPVFIVTEKEAIENEKQKSTGTKTWKYKADMVRDFAFASSRKFIWDAMAVPLPEGNTPLAMSLYPKEGNPLWEKESTKAVKETLELYSERTFDYPYPVAISVHAASVGMEYPMICFNYGRPRPDGSYSESLKWGMITVIIHEVGHNWFPMIVNSDERQWTWMDEGLNTYLETQTLFDRYPSYTGNWGTPSGVRYYMKNAANIRPIMTASDNIYYNNFGYNGYGKPAAALNLLRESIMGEELFDYAFKEYANRWKFKHPTPADFFRTMEDASAVDLDWFWKAWFFGTDYVDISIDNVEHYKMGVENDPERKITEETVIDVSQADGAQDSESTAFIKGPKNLELLDSPSYFYGEFRNQLDDDKVRAMARDKEFYFIEFSNKGGIPSPIIVEFEFEDGTTQREHIPADIWRKNESKVGKVFILDKKVVAVEFDPRMKLGDADDENNIYPRLGGSNSRFDRFMDENQD